MVGASVSENEHTHALPLASGGSGGVGPPTLGQWPAPLSLSCGPVNEEATYGPWTLVRQASRGKHTHVNVA